MQALQLRIARGEQTPQCFVNYDYCVFTDRTIFSYHVLYEHKWVLGNIMLQTCYKSASRVYQRVELFRPRSGWTSDEVASRTKAFFESLHNAWLLAVYTHHPGRNLVYKNKTIKSDVVRETDPLQSTCNSAEQTKKSRKIASPQITAHINFSEAF